MGIVVNLGSRLVIVRTIEQQEDHRKSVHKSLVVAKNRARAAKRRSALKSRTPPWADLEAIADVYKKAEKMWKTTGVRHDVDHVIPLQGELVSGLHVAENLQVLRWDLNRIKSNQFSVDDEPATPAV